MSRNDQSLTWHLEGRENGLENSSSFLVGLIAEDHTHQEGFGVFNES